MDATSPPLGYRHYYPSYTHPIVSECPETSAKASVRVQTQNLALTLVSAMLGDMKQDTFIQINKDVCQSHETLSRGNGIHAVVCGHQSISGGGGRSAVKRTKALVSSRHYIAVLIFFVESIETRVRGSWPAIVRER